AARPADARAQLELGAALVARARDATDRRQAALLFEDAHAAAERAGSLGADEPRLDALVAVIAAEQGDFETARARAVAAIESGWFDDEGAATFDSASRLSLLRLF